MLYSGQMGGGQKPRFALARRSLDDSTCFELLSFSAGVKRFTRRGVLGYPQVPSFGSFSGQAENEQIKLKKCKENFIKSVLPLLFAGARNQI